MEKIPAILGTPTISHIINVMKEIDTLVMPWPNARMAHLLSIWRDTATIADDQATEEPSLDEYNEVVLTKNTETVDAFSSQVIPMKAEKAYTGDYINVPKHYKLKMALYHRVSLCKMHTLSWGKVAKMQSWWWGIVQPTSKTVIKKTPVVRAVATTVVPELLVETRLPEGKDEP